MVDVRSAHISGTKADIDYVVKRLEQLSVGAVKVTPIAAANASLSDEPRVGQFEVITVVVDFVVAVGGHAAYDLLKHEVRTMRGKHVNIEDDGKEGGGSLGDEEGS